MPSWKVTSGGRAEKRKGVPRAGTSETKGPPTGHSSLFRTTVHMLWGGSLISVVLFHAAGTSKPPQHERRGAPTERMQFQLDDQT